MIKIFPQNKRGGQIKFLTSIVLVGLFTIAIVTYAMKFAIDNDTIVNLANDPDFVGIKSDISENVTTFYSDANISRKAIAESTISTQTEATEGGTAFKVIALAPISMITSTIKMGYQKIFGSDPAFEIFIIALISILVIISGLYIYKTLAGRDPD